MLVNIRDSIIFSLLFVIVGFIISYITDFVNGVKIIWWPDHGLDMASGTFFTAIVIFILFSEKYVNYRKLKDQ